MTTVNKRRRKLMNRNELNWLRATYQLVAELTPDKEAFLKAIKQLAQFKKDANASGKDNG